MDHSGEVLVNFLIPPLMAAVMGAVALGLGALLTQPFYSKRRPPFVESFALGALTISLLTLLWGALGWMTFSGRWSLVFVIMLLAVLGWIRPRVSSPLNLRTLRNRTILVLMLLLVVAVVFKVLLYALYPPYAAEECSTYLPSALFLLHAGRMIYDPSIAFSGMPQNSEMLYAWALTAKPLSNAHYVNVLAFLFSLLAIIRLGRAAFSLKTGWLAALIMGTVGAFQWFAYHSYPDLWVMFYLLAAVMVGVEAYREGAPARLILAGTFMGAAAGSSYVGAIGAVTLAVSLIALIGWRMPDVKPVQKEDVFTAVLMAMAIASPWYIRNLVWFHNPFFPFVSKVFHAGGGTYGLYAESAVPLSWLMAGDTAIAYFTSGVLWTKMVSLWPLWGAAAAGIWFWRSSPFIRLCVTWCVLSWGYWMINGGLMQSSLYVYLIPVTALAIAHFARMIYTSPPGDRRGRFVRIVLWALLIIWVAVLTTRDTNVAPPLTEKDRRDFLVQNIDSYELIEAANIVIPKDGVAVGVGCADARLYAEFALMGGSDVGLANHTVVAASAARSPVNLAALVGGRYSASFLIVNEKWLDSTERVSFMAIKNAIQTQEFARIFKEVARAGTGAVYFLAEPQTLGVVTNPTASQDATPETPQPEQP